MWWAVLVMVCVMSASARAQGSDTPAPAVLQVANATIPTRVLSESPADTVTELQIICLFHSDSGNQLQGALVETNDKLHGLLGRIRTPDRFKGALGETLLIAPPAGTLGAKRLLIIGLGDSQTFIPERMELVGSMAYAEANRLGVAHPFFAPTVIDGGVKKFTTGEVAEQFMYGFLRAADTEKQLMHDGESSGVSVHDLTYLAGAKFAAVTRDGIAKAFASLGTKP